MKRILLCAIIFVFALASTGYPRPPHSHPTPAPTPRGLTISSVSGNTITVSDENSSKTVSLNPLAEITLNGQRATLADLKSGMKVSLGLSDPMHASRVTATTTK